MLFYTWVGKMLKYKMKNIILAIGLGCIGLLVTCVGLGERGFHSTVLKLLGPSIFVTGFRNIF